MTIKTRFANLAEKVLKESDEALPVVVIIERVASLKTSNRYLKDVTRRTASSVFRMDKRFTKHAQEGWRVDLWTLAEE